MASRRLIRFNLCEPAFVGSGSHASKMPSGGSGLATTSVVPGDGAATAGAYDGRVRGNAVDMQAPTRRSVSEADDVLIRRAAAGEIAAFDSLVVPRRQRCYRLAQSILANEADAADATQDALMAAWRELPKLRDAGAFDGWLTRIVANASLMARRHRTRLREVSDSPETLDARDATTWEPAFVAGQDESDACAERDAIGRAFDRLSPADRVILVLHHVDERPVLEIAMMLYVPVGTAKWRLHAARKALERAIEAES